jgi:aminoglycoside phosphotransferase (APT) family kinase protein
MDGFGLVPLAGGHSGETFLAESAGERTVVRIYADRGARRGPRAVEVDAAVLRLVRGLLPVPEVLEVRRADPAAGTPALLVTSLLPGERLDVVLPAADDDLRRCLGRQVGEVVARLAQMPMPRPGLFADADLRLEPLPAHDLTEWVSVHREGLALGPDEYDGLLRVAERAQVLLDETGRSCLVHSDLNPKNVLVDPASGVVTGLLDWEFAHAGSPFEDLGNLLRFEREPLFAESVLATYRERVPDAPTEVADLLDRARAADLFALVDLAARRGENPVTERAHALLRQIARSRDLHAWP